MRVHGPCWAPPGLALALVAALLCAAVPHAAAAGRGLRQDDLALPSRLSDLCSGTVLDNSQFLPADGFTRESIGQLLRLQTPTANWGYYRFGENSTNPAIVLLAGFGDALAGWPLQFLDALSADREVIMVDLRGQGQTQDLAPLQALTVLSMADEVLEFIQALGLEQPPDVLGWSLGGGVAVAMAARHGEQLGRFVILEGSAGGTGSVPPTPRALRILSSPNTTETLALSLLFPLNTTQGIELACWFGQARAAAAQKPNTSIRRQLDAWLSWLEPGSGVMDQLGSIDNPMLLVAGKADELVPPANSQVIAQCLPEARLLLLDGAYTSWLQQSQEFLLALAAFLEQGG